MPLIELSKVSKAYLINKNEKKYVLKDITLSFPETGLISILGKSGCGKSTLLNLIGGLDKSSEGTIYYKGDNIAKYKNKQQVAFRKSEISYIFQHYHLLENQTALYNIMLPCLLNGDSFKVAKEKVLSLINKFSITEVLLNKKCSKLSGGEKERIAIMRAFISKTNVILADEPTGALDSKTGVEVLKLLRKQCDGNNGANTVIIVTHNSLFAEIADTVVHVKNGKIEEVIHNEKPKKIDEVVW